MRSTTCRGLPSPTGTTVHDFHRFGLGRVPTRALCARPAALQNTLRRTHSREPRTLVYDTLSNTTRPNSQLDTLVGRWSGQHDGLLVGLVQAARDLGLFSRHKSGAIRVSRKSTQELGVGFFSSDLDVRSRSRESSNAPEVARAAFRRTRSIVLSTPQSSPPALVAKPTSEIQKSRAPCRFETPTSCEQFGARHSACVRHTGAICVS